MALSQGISVKCGALTRICTTWYLPTVVRNCASVERMIQRRLSLHRAKRWYGNTVNSTVHAALQHVHLLAYVSLCVTPLSSPRKRYSGVFWLLIANWIHVHPPSSRDLEHPAKAPTSKGLTDFRVDTLRFGGPRNTVDCGLDEDGYCSTCLRKYPKSAELTSITVRQSGVIFVSPNLQVIPCGTNSVG